jgi:hypothetical protein
MATGVYSIFILSPYFIFMLKYEHMGSHGKTISLLLQQFLPRKSGVKGWRKSRGKGGKGKSSSAYLESLASRAEESPEERAGKESRLQLTKRGSRGPEAEGRGRDDAGSPQAHPIAPTPKLHSFFQIKRCSPSR